MRRDQQLTVSGSKLNIPAQPGDLYQNRNDAKNLVMRDAPAGPWVATTKVNFQGTVQYQQAGLVIYGNDDNFTKFGRIATNAPAAAFAEKFEYIYENNGTARNDAADSTANLAGDVPAGLLPADHVRRDEHHRRVLDRRQRVDDRRPGRAAAGGRQDRPVRLQQRRRGQPRRRLRLVHPHR